MYFRKFNQFWCLTELWKANETRNLHKYKKKSKSKRQSQSSGKGMPGQRGKWQEWEGKLFSSCLTGNGNENVSDLLALALLFEFIEMTVLPSPA